MAPSAPRSVLHDTSQAALVALTVLAFLTALWAARTIVVPLAGALVLYLVLRPLVNWATHFSVPKMLSAAIILVCLLGSVAAGLNTLREPAVAWLERAPEIAFELRYKLIELREPVQKAKEASEKVEAIADLESQDGQTQEVVVKEPGLLARMSSDIWQILGGLVMMTVLLYFLLASGDALLSRLIASVPHVGTRQRAERILTQVQGDVAVYLGTVSVINAALGLCLGVAFYFSGLPNPALWAVMAACLNFVPYLGALVCVVLVALISVLSFDTLAAAAVPPLAYVVFSTLEGQFVTPMLVGRRLQLNPLVVVLAVLFWTWMWGIAGALLALPMMVSIRALAQSITPLQGFAQALGSGAPAAADAR